MEQITLSKVFIVATLEIIFLLISFIFIGLGLKELKRKKNTFNNIALISTGIIFAIISLYCAKVLLLY